jgi:hypothetical protein
MQRIFTERMFSPVYDLMDASSHEWRGIIQSYIGDRVSQYRLMTPLELCLRKQPVLLCRSIMSAE